MIGVTVTVEGMRCDGCAETVKALLDMDRTRHGRPRGVVDPVRPVRLDPAACVTAP
jgi:hypothetical protein